ncbi:MAG: uroporphyrinogen decarboxylase [Acetobacteraceae bacterium]|nr:uroporphyrinogen decarboxylase [Acetobacteraceae bacterium]
MEKPLMRALAGEPVWPPPLWVMRQAGRYLPEYRALRAEVPDLLTLFTTPDLATEITLQPIRRFGFDAAILFSDILILPWALGHPLRFAEGPVLPKLSDPASLATLDLNRMPERVEAVIETVRRVRARLDAKTALIGFAGAPFTVACYMVEGGGSADFASARLMAHAKPALFSKLVSLLTQATIAFLTQQLEAGADAVMLFDSWAGVLPPSLFGAHVIESSRRITESLKARFPHARVIGFPRLAGLMFPAYAAKTSVDAAGMDTSVDPAVARRLVPEGVALQGNLDPQALVAGGMALESETRAILTAMRGHPFVFNLGHGIVPHTPVDHVCALVQMVRNA